MQASTNIPGRPKGPSHFTAQGKRSHVHAFKTSSQTMTAYCKRHGIPISTFSSWVSKYGPVKKGAEEFIPAQVSSALSAQKSMPVTQKTMTTQVIEIYRGDLKVVLPVFDVLMAIEIIKGVLLCN